MPHDDFAFEAEPGLPEALPKGETMLWRGRPSAWALARDALAIRIVAVYFIALAGWRALVVGGEPPLGEALKAAIWPLAIGAVACAILFAIAYVQARATIYTVTTRRVVMRVGAALQVTFNLPYKQIAGAALQPRRDGTGTIALKLKGENRISYLICWPSVRPWRFSRCEPALRAIPDAAKVAKILAEAAEGEISAPVISRAKPAETRAAPQSGPAAIPAE